MIACIPSQKNEFQNQNKKQVKQFVKSAHQEDSIKMKGSPKEMKDQDKENFKYIQKYPNPQPQQLQKPFERRVNTYFKYEDKNRLSSLSNIIQSMQRSKPIRLYLENVPIFANEFDFEERCRGLLNVVWNYKRANSCFILVENKDFALDILDLESELPPYCKEGRIFVTRVEENSILYGKKPNPKRFENYYNLSDDSGFFIVENDTMKYYWYDVKKGFYDEFGIYYNQQGRPSPPPYINQNHRNGRSRKSNRGNNERNIKGNTTNKINNERNGRDENQNNKNNNNIFKNTQQQEQKNTQSPKSNSQRQQQVEYVKKQNVEVTIENKYQNKENQQNINKEQHNKNYKQNDFTKNKQKKQ